jgi:RNA polymerase-binding transcription factor DksA
MTTVADILGLSRKPEVQVRWVKQYEQLCAERDRLMARDCSTPEISRARMDDLGDAASEDCQTSMALVSTSATQDILAQVLDAIRRIERGTFGICEITGEPIEVERLQAIPWTRYSFHGQRELEREGFGRSSVLAPLQSLSEAGAEAEAETESSEHAD